MRRRCGVVSGGHRRRVARSAQQPPPPPPQRGRRVSGEDTGGAPERQALFNDIAGQYDLLNDVLSAGQHRVWKQMAVRWSRVGAGGDALDVCCGSGDLALALAAAVGPSGSVTGLDFAVEQLRVASRKQAASGAASRTPMRWVEGDALQLPFADGAFDAVTIGYGLRNVVDIPRCLREARRVLRPRGALVVLDFNNSDGPAAAVQKAALAGVVVPVATALGLGDQYAYLQPSIEAYPKGPELERLAKQAGFAAATHYEIAGGLMGALVADV